MGPCQRPQGQRPRPHLRGDPGGLRQGALTAISARSLADRLRPVLTHPTLRAAGPDDPDLPWRWGDVLDAQRAGDDPTRPWRDALSAGTARQYAVAPPPSMPAAFVLQWLLEAAAVPAVYAALHSAHVVDPVRSGLSLALDPSQLYPVALQLREAAVTPALLDDRLEAAHAAYLSAATELALTYHPGVHLGPHQRLEMVHDVWAMALARARGQRPPARGSCCYLYVLPGTHECTGCPRLRRRPVAGDAPTAPTGSARP